jgi:glycerol-3-phosphate acyltransferase PlsY
MSTSWVWVAVAVAAGFFVGAVSPATIVARVRKADLTQGSGNPGATNTGRLLGLRWGVVVAVMDVLKGLVPTAVALWWLGRPTAYAVGLACVLGHVLSPYLRGRGGKGVATSLGAILAVFPLFALGLVALFGLVLWRTRWVAGASLAAAVALAVWSAFGPLPEPVLLGRLWGLAVALVIIARHHGNIRWWLRQRRG